MAKNIENFRDELVKFANVVESIEDSFIGGDYVEITTYLDDVFYERLSRELNNGKRTKCVISIGNVNFIFLKK